MTILVAASVALAACADPAPDNVATPTTTLPDVDALPKLTTTTVPGGRADRDYQALGLTPSQSSCLLASQVDRPVDVTMAPQADGPIEVVVDDGVSITLPAGLRTAVEVWRALLGTVATTCLSGDELDSVAVTLGQDDDQRAVSEDLPGLLDARRSVGFTPEELSCLDARLRAAPARISSLGADPRVADEACVEAERLRYLRLTSVRNRLLLAGATEDEAACLLATPSDVEAIDQAAGLLAANDGAALGDLDTSCLSVERLGSLAVTVAASDIQLSNDFG